MKKTGIDWSPSNNLAHKINVDTLQAASDRAEHMALQQKRMEEAMASTAIAESFTEDSAIREDTNSRYSNQETQTTEVLYVCKIVQTHRPKFGNISVKTDETIFYERNFLVDDTNMHYYTGVANCNLLRSIFEFMKKLANDDKQSYCSIVGAPLL